MVSAWAGSRIRLCCRPLGGCAPKTGPKMLEQANRYSARVTATARSLPTTFPHYLSLPFDFSIIKSAVGMKELADHGDDGVASKRDAIAAHAHTYVPPPRASHPSEQRRLIEAICPERTKCAVCRATNRVLVNANAGREPARREVVYRRIG